MQKVNKILTPYSKNGFKLKSRLVMAPMTRSRAIDNLPNELMEEYYGQRTGAGLIITEGTSPMPNGLGYPRIPGIYSKNQIYGWSLTTQKVHQGNSKIFCQLMHTGRIGHEDNLPEGEQLVSPSDIKAAGQIFTDTLGLQEFSSPVALTTEGVKNIIQGHVTASRNAMEAGFDGVELHGANGYLIEQFLHPVVNNRTDEYGGDLKHRAAFVLELVEKITAAIGKNHVGIRFSPFSTMGDLPAYNPEEVHETYVYLAEQLNKLGIAYIHIGLSPEIPQKTLDAIRSTFNGTILICNGLTPESAEAALEKGFADIVAFARSYLANPDLDRRIEKNAALNIPDLSTAYTPGAKGYTDYPTLAGSKEKALLVGLN
jgi:N-ethylmaleimide reductase